MTDKVIITHGGALRAKYGAAGFQQVRDAVKALVAKDKTRGLATKLILIDRKNQMKAVGGPDVDDAGDEKLVKRAVDAIAKKLAPDYLLLLGAPDVLPHQTLLDQTGHDTAIPSDLPYACNKPYSTKAGDFLAPTRVVGRLPDLVGAKKPTYLVRLLKTATGWSSKPASAYADCFGLTAKAWVRSTEESLTRTFGSHQGLFTSPPRKGSTWTSNQLAPLMHFVNCHGAEIDPFFYGDPGDPLPISHASARIRPKIRKRTVATAECCYGAQLYDPSIVGEMGICSTYLDKGAYAFFGSTTIAYGPAAGNDYADLITQYFLQNVLAGMSTGRAVLQARLDYVSGSSHADPFSEKTLAQFTLLGDPSVHPVKVAATTKAMPAAAGPRPKATAKAKVPVSRPPAGRSERRLGLEVLGEALGRSLGRVLHRARAQIRQEVRRGIDDLLDELQLQAERIQTFDVSLPATTKALAKGLAVARKAAPAIRYYLIDAAAQGAPAPEPAPKGVAAKGLERAARASGGPRRQEFLLVRAEDGQMVDRKHLYRR